MSPQDSPRLAGTQRGRAPTILEANLKSISHRCHLILVAFVWELTKETIHLPLVCIQGGWTERCQSPSLCTSARDFRSCFRGWGFFFFFTLVTGPRRSLSLKLSDTKV